MPQSLQYTNIPVIDGVNYVIPSNDTAFFYNIINTVTLTSNWSIAMTPTSTAPLRCFITWLANIILNGNHVYIFGTQIPDKLADKTFIASCFFNGTTWDVEILPGFEEQQFIETNDIVDDAVTNDKLNNMIRGSVKVGGTSDAPTDLDAKTSGYILVGDGIDIKSVAVSGDATLASSGAITISNDAVNNNKLANMVRGTVKVGGTSDVPTDLVASGSGKILIGDGTDIKSVSVTGDVTITSAGVTTVNPALLTTPVLEAGSGLLSIQSAPTASTGCVASGDYSIAMGFHTTASGLVSYAEGENTIASGNYSHAAGNGSTASGFISYARGNGVIASGNYSIADGFGCQAIGDNSIAKGLNSISRGNHSIAKGVESVSYLTHSIAFASGEFTIPGDCEELKVFAKVVTTNNVPANLLLGDGVTTAIEIPTDCIMDFECRYSALQTGGSAGTAGDGVTQKITFSVRNLAGTLTLLTQGIATTATIVTVAGNICSYEQAKIGALTVTCVPTISGTKVLFVVTGEVNKDIQHSLLINTTINGFNNFAI